MRINMKSIPRLLAVFAITLAIVSFNSCKKGDTGPAGPAGPAGPQGSQGTAGAIGPTGQSGNANVMQYVFSSANGIDLTGASPNNFVPLFLDASNDTLINSAWFAYMFKAGAWYAIPGHGEGDASVYSFSYGYETQALDTALFFIDRVSGPGEVYDLVKLVRIFASNDITTNAANRNGSRGLPNIDFKNYAEVKKYYNLP
jgi:hypothetical protein